MTGGSLAEINVTRGAGGDFTSRPVDDLVKDEGVKVTVGDEGCVGRNDGWIG